MEFSIGQSEHENVVVDVLAYERAAVGELYDDNWLRTQIRVAAGGFRGKVSAAILTVDLVRFAKELKPLVTNLSGTAEFSTLEEQLSLRVSCDKTGHVTLLGNIADRPGIGNRLHFTLRLDQSELGRSIQQLDAVIVKFPERMQPNQLPDPTSPSVTRPAGAGHAPSVAADH